MCTPRAIHPFLIMLLSGVVTFHASSVRAEPQQVLDPDGRVIEVFDEDESVTLSERYDGPATASSAEPGASEAVVHEDSVSGYRVEADGTITQGTLAAAAQAASGTVTIDSMTLRDSTDTYHPAATIKLLGTADRYTLSDGSGWGSGAGSSYTHAAYLERVEVDGTTIRYFLRPQSDESLIYQQIDYDAGNQSSAGKLAASGALVLEAEIGSSTAVLRGGAEIVENAPVNYPEPRFKYFSAVVGAVVPYELSYVLTSGTWQPDSFDVSFSYRRQGGWVDFAHPMDLPDSVRVEILGPGLAPSHSVLHYRAIAHYDNGSMANVTTRATWSISDDSIATIDAGVLRTSEVPEEGAAVEIRAAFEEGGVELAGVKRVGLVPRESIDSRFGVWPTYQGNHGHTGHVPTALESGAFRLRWERVLGAGRALHQVAAGDGRVFVSAASRFVDDTQLWALDAIDGEELWSKGFGGVSSVNPPALAYDTVYLQTGKTVGGGSSQPPHLRAFDAATGDPVFESPTAAQWESHLAPTPHDGRVYINGGYYGGMYGFDAFSGTQEWFLDLPQYDDWTPAVDDEYAYAYVGEYSPGLYVADRATGALVFRIPDDDFDWNGWSMNLAPVLGGRQDVVAIHDGRLIRFDVFGRRIDWQKAAAFSGQPAVRDGVIHALDGGQLVALDQDTGEERWRWGTRTGAALVGEVLVTDSYVFAHTESSTHAVEVLSGIESWEFPRGGSLALANDTLYIAQASGRLTAIAMPEIIPAVVERIEIEAPGQVLEFSTTQLRAHAHYADGRVRDRSALAVWSLEPPEAGAISEDGELTMGELFEPETSFEVHAVYEQDGVTVSDRVEITAKISVPVEDLVRRNLEAARQLRESVAPVLAEARMREDAARDVLFGIKLGAIEATLSRSGARRVLRAMGHVRFWGFFADHSLGRAIESLQGAMEELDAPDPEEPPHQPWWARWLR